MFILILLGILLHYYLMFFLLLYMYIHFFLHLTITTFVPEHLLYLIVYHDMNIFCSNTDVVLTSCWLCLFMTREPGIT